MSDITWTVNMCMNFEQKFYIFPNNNLEDFSSLFCDKD